MFGYLRRCACLDRRRRRRRASGVQLIGERLHEGAPQLATHRHIGLRRHLQLARRQLPHVNKMNGNVLPGRF